MGNEELVFAVIEEGNAQRLRELLALDPAAAQTWRMDRLATPLHACMGKPELAQILLDYEADPNSIDTDDDLQTPLHLAAELGDVDTTRLLLAGGADINARSCHGTPLHHALGNSGDLPDGYMEILPVLVDAGADVNACIQEGKDVWTPLHQACSEGLCDAVEYLLGKGAKVFLNKDGLTPLRVAKSMGFNDVCTLLSKHGAR